MFQLKRVGLVFVAVLALGVGATAKADTVVVGNSTGNLATATVSCTFNDATNTFNFTITNTSPFDARITGIGFDLGAGNISGFSGANVGAFTFSDGDLGNVPQFNSAVLDFGFITGSNFSGGNPPTGLAPNTSLAFTVTGAGFGNGLTADQICNAIFVRFQRVGADGQGSDVGTAQPIPEPTSMFLLGAGLTGFAALLRRRRIGNKQ